MGGVVIRKDGSTQECIYNVCFGCIFHRIKIMENMNCKYTLALWAYVVFAQEVR